MQRVLEHDREIVFGGLLIVIVLAWSYLLAGAGMSNHAGMESPAAWTTEYFMLMLFMWVVMMAAMMLPGAAPMILLFSALSRRSAERGQPATFTGVFAAGYALVWSGFSLIATWLQMQLDSFGLLDTAMASGDVPLGAALLMAAGIYQMSPLKYACLRHCRTPIDYFARHWRKGTGGALRMGLEHGTYCLGCCWVMMGLLFYAGVMNLYWIIGIALYVLIEKLAPAGHVIGRITGATLILWGAIVLVIHV